MVWMRKPVNIDERRKAENHFETVFEALGSPRGMLLVCADSDKMGSTVLYALIPNTVAPTVLPNFERVDETKVPREAIMLVGHNDDFHGRFETAASAKRSAS
jgi:hypothetical protein